MQKMQKRFSFTAVLFVTAILSSCASQTQHLSSSARSSIHTVSVNPVITMPTSMDYSGHHQVGSMMMGGMVAGSLGELVGEGVADASESSTRANLLKTMNRRGIKLNQLLYQAFSKDLENQTNFKVSRTKIYDAQFKLTINSFGFIDKTQSTGTMPFMDVTGQLIDHQGNVVWQTTKEIDLDNSQMGGYTVDSYLKNRAVMRKGFSALASQASDDLISTLMV